MKRFVRLFFMAALLLTSVTSCMASHSMKRDCQGNRHYRLKNGIYI